MSKVMLNPYLNFNGNTAEAMEFYHSVFGGKLEMQKFSDAKGMEVPAGYEDKILHSKLESDEVVLMASEGKPDTDVVFGDNISMSLMGSDHDKLAEIFNALAEGGEVTMPLALQFWGDTFGELTDKFGIHWMVNITK